MTTTGKRVRDDATEEEMNAWNESGYEGKHRGEPQFADDMLVRLNFKALQQ